MFKNPVLTLIASTGFEVAGLILWFEFDRRGIPAGLVVMFLGFVLERIVVIGIPDKLDVWLGVIGSSWWEYAVWALWFILIQNRGAGPIEVFVLVFFPGIHFQHAFGASMKFNRLFPELVRNPGFITFSLIEAIGGGLWLALFVSQPSSLLPHLIIIITITIEHIVQGFVLGSLNKVPTSTQLAAAH
jgi:hypothetical protein